MTQTTPITDRAFTDQHQSGPAAPHRLRIATRGSLLALWQANHVRTLLYQIHGDTVSIELVVLKTTGDRILDTSLAAIGGKGLFVKELEEALLDGRADLAVHSMKDVPAVIPPGLALTAVLERADPRDALLATHVTSIARLPKGARVGSSSLRRRCQLLHMRPDLHIELLRGNVDTRIRRLENGDFDAILLAAAGLQRLGRTERIVGYFEPDQIVPAVGQGTIGIEIRADDATTATHIAPLNHPVSWLRTQAERALLEELDGDCRIPIGGHATITPDDTLYMRGFLSDLTGTRILKSNRVGPLDQPALLGRQVAQDLKDQGGIELVATMRSAP
jgi:hydroxymethylbilane synthase